VAGEPNLEEEKLHRASHYVTFGEQKLLSMGGLVFKARRRGFNATFPKWAKGHRDVYRPAYSPEIKMTPRDTSMD
jgi:hypothetical protein